MTPSALLGATAVVVNVTVTDTTTSGYLFPASAGESPESSASDLNWTKGRTIANLVVVKLGPAP